MKCRGAGDNLWYVKESGIYEVLSKEEFRDSQVLSEFDGKLKKYYPCAYNSFSDEKKKRLCKKNKYKFY